MRLSPALSEWLNLLARWFHVFAAIMWVGSTYYFTWLDGRFQEEEREAKEAGADPEVWMVHSGGFYVVGKRKTPSLKRLHWFRWEAASTWLSGMVLLTLVYYHGGAMVDPDVRDIGAWTAGAFGVGMLMAGWVVYDLLVRSPLGRNEKAFAVVAYALVGRGRQELSGEDPVYQRGQSGANRASRRVEDPLSERELEVLNLLASGKTNSEVAGDLFVSVGTVKSHTGNIYRKLGARNRAEALATARDLGLIQ